MGETNKTSKLVRMYTSDYDLLDEWSRNSLRPVTVVIHTIIDRLQNEFGYSFLMKGLYK